MKRGAQIGCPLFDGHRFDDFCCATDVTQILKWTDHRLSLMEEGTGLVKLLAVDSFIHSNVAMWAHKRSLLPEFDTQLVLFFMLVVVKLTVNVAAPQVNE